MKYAYITIVLLLLAVGVFGLATTRGDEVCTFHPASHQVHCAHAPAVFGRMLAIYDRHTRSGEQICLLHTDAQHVECKRIL
jgi:hypothetical protein